jgi:hypothetical protein
MKFKARFSEVGAGWLEKRFLPAFEKLSPAKGVELVLLLTPETVHLIHDAKAQGGAEIHADFVVRTALLTWLLQLRAWPFPTLAQRQRLTRALTLFAVLVPPSTGVGAV